MVSCSWRNEDPPAVKYDHSARELGFVNVRRQFFHEIPNVQEDTVRLVKDCSICSKEELFKGI